MDIHGSLRMRTFFVPLSWIKVLRILCELTVESCLQLIKFVIQLLFLLVEVKLFEFVHIIFVIDLTYQLLIGCLQQR